jgi:hypothetical protein
MSNCKMVGHLHIKFQPNLPVSCKANRLLQSKIRNWIDIRRSNSMLAVSSF